MTRRKIQCEPDLTRVVRETANSLPKMQSRLGGRADVQIHHARFTFALASTSRLCVDAPRRFPADCVDVYNAQTTGARNDGIYEIWPDGAERPFSVQCTFDSEGLWTEIQRRQDGGTSFQVRARVCTKPCEKAPSLYNKSAHPLTFVNSGQIRLVQGAM